MMRRRRPVTAVIEPLWRVLRVFGWALAIQMVACSSRSGPSGQPPPSPSGGPSTVTGTWTGKMGPSRNDLSYGVRLEIVEDGGAVTGEFFDENPSDPTQLLPTGSIQGMRDGGSLTLTIGKVSRLRDGGFTTVDTLTGVVSLPDKIEGTLRTGVAGGEPMNAAIALVRDH